MQNSSGFPLIIAHRGASALAPENTMAAFERALADEAHGIEFDVQMTKDGVPVVFHDATLQRMARRNERVSNLTSEELRTLDIGAWFNRTYPKRADDKFTGESVPALARLFDFLMGYKGRVYVELKGASGEMLPLVEAIGKMIRQTQLLPNIIVKSFNLEAVAQFKKLFPEIPTAALFEPKMVLILRGRRRLIELARNCGANELSLHYSLATKKLLESATRENLPVTIWTVDRPAWVKRARETGIRAIITNNPARLVAARAEILRRGAIPV